MGILSIAKKTTLPSKYCINSNYRSYKLTIFVMIKVKDINNAPAILGEKERNFAFQKMDALKGMHVSFTGYSIADGEEIYFPSAEELEKNPNKYLKIGVTQKGSTNKSALVLVNRKAPGSDTIRAGWFNISVLSRTAKDAEGHVVQIDDLRARMNLLKDDYDRVQACLGKKLIGTGVRSDLYVPKMSDSRRVLDSNGKVVYEQADVVTTKLTTQNGQDPNDILGKLEQSELTKESFTKDFTRYTEWAPNLTISCFDKLGVDEDGEVYFEGFDIVDAREEWVFWNRYIVLVFDEQLSCNGNSERALNVSRIAHRIQSIESTTKIILYNQKKREYLPIKEYESNIIFGCFIEGDRDTSVIL